MPDPDQIPYVRQVKQLTNINEIRDVPVIGSLYGAGNTVIDYFESDCHPDWTIYAETLFPALGQAVLVLLSFGLDDVLRGYLRPAGGRGFGGLGRASRRIRKPTRAQAVRGKLKGGIPEIGELIGKNLPGAQVVKARNVGNAERFLWKVDGLAQRGLWYWMIADILDDFTVNWTTALLQSVDCIGVEVGGITRRGSGFAVSQNPNFSPVILPEIVDEYGFIQSTATTLVIPPGFNGSLSVFASYSMVFGAGPVEVGIQRDHGGVRWSGAGTVDPETGLLQAATAIHSFGGETLRWGVRVHDGRALFDEVVGVAVISGAGPP